jgi:hypothetical protein
LKAGLPIESPPLSKALQMEMIMEIDEVTHLKKHDLATGKIVLNIQIE